MQVADHLPKELHFVADDSCVGKMGIMNSLYEESRCNVHNVTYNE